MKGRSTLQIHQSEPYESLYFKSFFLLIHFFAAHITSNLYEAIQNFHDNTCLTFVPYDGSQPNYIRFDNDYGYVVNILNQVFWCSEDPK